MTIKAMHEDGVGRIALNRPERKNPLSIDVLRQIIERLDAFQAEGVRVAIIAGEGDDFSSGFTLETDGKGEVRRPDRPVDDIARLRRLGELLLRIRRHPVVTIAEIKGYCVAGGTDLLLACDLAVAARDARIGLPNIRSLGVSLMSPMLSLTIGAARTKLLMFTGDYISGAQAEEWGLVALSAPRDALVAIAERLAKRISLTSEDLLASAKSASNRAVELVNAEALVASAVELDALAHVSEPAEAFWRSARQDGLKATLRARDARYAGDSLEAIIADCAPRA